MMNIVTFHVSGDDRYTSATGTYIQDGHKIRLEATSRIAFGGKPAQTTLRSLHFHDGEWKEVLPTHEIDYCETETQLRNRFAAVHLANTVRFLNHGK